MKALFIAIALPIALTLTAAEGTLLFEDNFERNESQETKDEVGKGWTTNSAKRAKGDKQVDLKDGAMYIFISPQADHGVSVVHELGFTDGRVELRFMLPEKSDSIGLNFADLKFKEVHAGHLCMARIKTNQVEINDLKTGNMRQDIRTAKQGDGLSAEQKKMLKTKQKTIKNKLEPGKWYNLAVSIAGETMTVVIDGKEIASFTSEGIAHPTKRTLRLSVPKNVWVDDIKLWKVK
jgi:hypothetical protein